MGALAETLLLANIAATLFMGGVIWYVQIVHYPLFERVGASHFVLYEKDHSHLTSLVVGPPMLVEAATALFLVPFGPAAIPSSAVWVGLGLIGAIWVSTALLQVPRHTRLGSGFESSHHRALVLSNWLRTAAWSLRALLVLWMLHLALS